MKRLGINNGRYHGEGLNVAEYLREFHEAALKLGWLAEQWAEIGGHKLFGYSRGDVNARRHIYLSSGMHGDEPAGAVALRRLLEENRWPADARFVLCPCINPSGLQNVTRENANGVDLNRDYKNPSASEVVAHTRWLNSLPYFDFSLLLHEDWEADGYYVYEVNWGSAKPLAPLILEAVREVAPIQPTSKIDGMWDCHDGIITPNVKPEERPLWAEAVYLIVNKTKQSLTLEAPSDFPLLFRAEAHVRAVHAALRR